MTADRLHVFVQDAVGSLTVPRGAPRLNAWRRQHFDWERGGWDAGRPGEGAGVPDTRPMLIFIYIHANSTWSALF